MCGLAGVIDPGLKREEGATLLERMLASIRHRGPDRSSTWIDMPVLLGHNRLSIIDLSELANQPMERGDLVIVHNGEVYNYIEIRAALVEKGHQFSSQSDTEVILAAYQEWGAECVNRFDGMWAFAIWDRANQELFCSRDRFGIKPFYYVHSGRRFYFGSEYKPLRLSPIFDSRLNHRHIRRGLQVGAVAYRDETHYECLRALPERSNLLFKNGTVTITRYWDIDGTRTYRGSFEDKTHRFLELFRDSVRLRMRSDVPVGGMLSGGLDSSSIAAVVATDFPEVPFKTFTIHYDGPSGMDERPWARRVVSAFPNIDAVYVKPTDEEIAHAYDAVVHAFDAPLPASPPLSCYFVMKAAARARVKVMLDGQGADEYLAGYEAAFDRQMAGFLRQLRVLAAVKALRDFRRERSVRLQTALRVALTSVLGAFVGEQSLYLRHFRPTVQELLWKGVPCSFERVPGSRMNEYAYHLIFGWFLPSLLQYGDRMSMAWSIECRVPFLDHRLVEFAFSLDDEDKIRAGESKYILRRSLEGILPGDIVGRKGKQRFLGGEVGGWLRGPLKHLTELPMRIDGLGLLAGRRAAGIVQDFKNGNETLAPAVWSLVGLNYWLIHQ